VDDSRHGQGIEHIPNDGMRGAVTLLSAYRIPNYQIAAAMRISLKTLLKYYRHELDVATTLTHAHVLTNWWKQIAAGDSRLIALYMRDNFQLNNGDAPALLLPCVLDNIPGESVDQRLLQTDVPEQGRSAEILPIDDETV
jgi:hypothetical protein